MSDWIDQEPDWHGHKAKRKRSMEAARSMFIPFAFIGLVVVAMLICGVVTFLSIRSAASGLPTVVAADQQTQRALQKTDDAGTTLAQVQITQTQSAFATLIALATLNAHTATPLPPTVTPIPLSDHLFEYSAANSTGRMLAAHSEPGSVFTGLRVAPDGNLYAAHTRTLDKPSCGSADAYWIIRPDGTRIGQIADPTMVSPRRIAFDSKGNRFIIAFESDPPQCDQFSQALFWFDAQNKLVTTYSLKLFNADAITVSMNDYIFVTISGFADSASTNGTAPSAGAADSTLHPRLIELTANMGTAAGIATQSVQVPQTPPGLNDVPNGAYLNEPSPVRFLALTAVSDMLYIVSQDATTTHLNQFPIPDADGTHSPSASTLTEINLSAVPTVHITDISAIDARHLIGFGTTPQGAEVFKIDLSSDAAVITSRINVTLSALESHAFAYNPAADSWFINDVRPSTPN